MLQSLCRNILVKSIPCEADFSNFKKRIGPEKFDEIFHVLVEIVKRVGLVTGKILILLTEPFSPPLPITKGAIMPLKNVEVIPYKKIF